ncbi:hypothetical protein [Arthrobacter alpinus]|nr:hypothetical protein [Arthrobacter alpinus]
MLLTHPTLNYAGVADWRPGRLAAMSPDTTASDIHDDAMALQAARFIYVDEQTEEVLIRSFLRHDGLLKQPKLSIAMVNAFGGIASSEIQQIITFELQRLRAEYPTWSAFQQGKVLALVKGLGRDMDEFRRSTGQEDAPVLPVTFTDNDQSRAQPFAQEVAQPHEQGQALPTTTATTTSTYVDKRVPPQKRGSRIPADFHISSEMAQWASANAPNVDINLETMTFKNYWEAKTGRDTTKLDWGKTWQNWILRSRANTVTTSKPSTGDKMRATFALGQQMQAQQNQTFQHEIGI